MNMSFCYNDVGRYFTVGSYIKKVVAEQEHIDIKSHARIPEDTGVFEEQCGLDLDLILVIDDGQSHFKLHHHKNKLPKKCKTAIWLSDLHHEMWRGWRLQMIREWHYDHVFYAQKNFKKMIIDCGYDVNSCSWLPHAVDSEIFKPLSHITKRHDIGYVGYKNDKRINAENVLKDYMDFKQYSSCWAWFANRCMNELKIGFNISVTDDINMRMFETMASGVPLLTNKIENNGMEDLFGDKEDYFLTYSSDEEMKEKAVRLIANPEMRKMIAEKGREHVLRHHTYKNRMNTILASFNFDLLK